jgi:hypothetical protein
MMCDVGAKESHSQVIPTVWHGPSEFPFLTPKPIFKRVVQAPESMVTSVLVAVPRFLISASFRLSIL